MPRYLIEWIIGTFVGTVFYRLCLKPIVRNWWRRHYTRTKKKL